MGIFHMSKSNSKYLEYYGLFDSEEAFKHVMQLAVLHWEAFVAHCVGFLC